MAKKSKRPSSSAKSKSSPSGRLSGKDIKHNRLSAGRLIVFSLIFSFIGGYAIYKSFAAKPGYSNTSYGVITGTVTGGKDTPVAGATVSVTVSGSKRTYTTSSKGLYYIPALPGGEYSLNFSAGKYGGNTVTSSATVGKITIKDVSLSPQ